MSGSATACPRSSSFDKDVNGSSECYTWNWSWIHYFIGIFDLFKGQGVSVQTFSMRIDSFVLSVLLWAGDSTTCALKCFKFICIPHITKKKIGSLIMKCLVWGFSLLMMALKAPRELLGQPPDHHSKCHLYFLVTRAEKKPKFWALRPFSLFFHGLKQAKSTFLKSPA